MKQVKGGICASPHPLRWRNPSLRWIAVQVLDQMTGLDAQVRELQGAGCEKIFTRQVSGVAPRGGQPSRVRLAK
jgi:hypothetical protein